MEPSVAIVLDAFTLAYFTTVQLSTVWVDNAVTNFFHRYSLRAPTSPTADFTAEVNLPQKCKVRFQCTLSSRYTSCTIFAVGTAVVRGVILVH